MRMYKKNARLKKRGIQVSPEVLQHITVNGIRITQNLCRQLQKDINAGNYDIAERYNPSFGEGVLAGEIGDEDDYC